MNNQIQTNTATTNGLAIYKHATNTTITGNTITKNNANNGGAIFDMKQ